MESLNLVRGKLKEVHDALMRYQCLCHLGQSCFGEQLDLFSSDAPLNITVDDPSCEQHNVMTRDEVLIKLGLIKLIADRANYCKTLRETHNLFANKPTLHQVGCLMSSSDQLVAYSASKCLSALLMTQSKADGALVQDYLQNCLKSIQDVNKETHTLSISIVTKMVFTFDIFANLLQASRSGVKCTETHRQPCLTAALGTGVERQHTQTQLLKRSAKDVASIACTSCQEIICKMTTIFAAHLQPDERQALLDDSQPKTFRTWLRSLDFPSSRKVCHSFFRTLFILTKYVFKQRMHSEEFVVHVHRILPQLASLVRVHCQGNLAILEIVLDTLNLCVQYRSKVANSPSLNQEEDSSVIEKTEDELTKVIQDLALYIVQPTWLKRVPFHKGLVGFGGTWFVGSGETKGAGDSVQGERALLRKLVKLIIGSLEHISTSSKHPHTLVTECVQKLSVYVAFAMDFQPSSSDMNIQPRDWIFMLFGDQDDTLIGTMLSLLKTSMALVSHTANEDINCQALVTTPTPETDDDQLGSCKEVYHSQEMSRTPQAQDTLVDCTLNPHQIFLSFLHHTTWDHSILLDHLISTETDFLEYLVRYLRYVATEWTSFVNAHKHKGNANFGIESASDCEELTNNSSANGRDKYSSDDVHPSNSDFSDDEDDNVEDKGNDNEYSGDQCISASSSNDTCNGTKKDIYGFSEESFCDDKIEGMETGLLHHHKRKHQNESQFLKLTSSGDNIMLTGKSTNTRENNADSLLDISIRESDAKSLLDEGQIHSQLINPSKESDTFLSESDDNSLGSHITSLDDTMTVMIRLRMVIERLHSKDLFPFSAKPLLRLLMTIEDLYEK